MASDPQDNVVELQELTAQPVVSIRAIIPTAQLPEVMGERVRALADYLRHSGAQSAGPFFVRYHTFNETETDMETGIPLVVPTTEAGPIRAGVLPSGPAITTWHHGPHPALGTAYARLTAWLQAHDRAPDGPAWEVYYWLDPRQNSDLSIEADPTTWGTQLVQPIR